MEYCPLPQNIIEHILLFVDVETLLMCKKVSPNFEEAVRVVSRKVNWHKAYASERGEIFPYAVSAKLYPHDEGLNCGNWKEIYLLCCKNHSLLHKEPYHITGIKVGREVSDIKKILIHGDLVVVLIKYNKNLSIFYRILIINSKDELIFRTCKLKYGCYYITSVKDVSNLREDAIDLKCNKCNLKAIPLNFSYYINGNPIIRPVPDSTFFKVVTSDKSNVFWFDSVHGFVDKADSFHADTEDKSDHVDILCKAFIKMYPYGSRFKVPHKDFFLELDTFKYLNSYFTVAVFYSNLLIAGTDTGMVYVYNNLDNKVKVVDLCLKNYALKIDVCSEVITDLNMMELPDQFVIVCCSVKNLYRIIFDRKITWFI